jgi:hypothetical protein
MGFQVNYDANEFRRRMEGFLDGILEIFKRSKGVTFPAKTAGEFVLKLMVWDKEMDTFARYCGEQGETVLADYWGAKALAYGMAGKVREGQSFFEKSRQRRTGGRFAEWNQTYYRSS